MHPTGLIGPIFPEFPGSLTWLGESVIWCCMIALLVAILLSLGIRRSPLYPVLLAIRDAEPFAEAAGARTALLKIGMFGLSAAMAGAAGWIFTFQGIVSPGQFSWSVSVNILVMVILGGMNTTIGPVLGAAFVTIFPAEVNINPFWQEILFGALFIGVIVIYPAGFIGFIKAAAIWLLRVLLPSRRRAPHPVLESPAVGAHATAQEAPFVVEAPPRVAAKRGTGGLAVECRDLFFAYTKGNPVLNGVDFVVRAGSIHGLIGPNGSGKTTLVELERSPSTSSASSSRGLLPGRATASCARSRRPCSCVS